MGPNTARPEGGSLDDAKLEASLMKVLGPQKKTILQVDLAESMKTAGLAMFFDADQWPDSGAVRELASQMKLKKFVACDLHKYVCVSQLRRCCMHCCLLQVPSILLP